MHTVPGMCVWGRIMNVLNSVDSVADWPENAA